MIYEWSEGSSRYRKVDPQMVGETVEKLAKRDGGVCSPSALVEEARSRNSLLHPVIFRLSQAEAAESWYQQEARKVINNLRVVEVPGEHSDAPAFLHVKLIRADGVREGYAPSRTVVESVDLHAQALAEALSALKGWYRRYQHLEELKPVVRAIEAVQTRV